MPTEPIYLRWENTSPPHRKFYELEVELSLFFPKEAIRRWGRIDGRRPRSMRLLVSDSAELDRLVAQVNRRRQRHGYHSVQALYDSKRQEVAV